MSKAGHNVVAADRLKAFIERVEKLEEERKSLGSDIREVFQEAKGVGFNVPAMKEIIRLRKQDADERDEHEAYVDLYKTALGMPADRAAISAAVRASDAMDDAAVQAIELLRQNVSIREVARQTGMKHASVQRLKAAMPEAVSPTADTPEHNPETGEIENGNPPQVARPSQGAAPRDGAAPHQSEAGASARKDEDSREPGVSAFPPRPAVCNPASDTPHGLTPVGNASGLSQVADLEMPAFLRRC